MRLSLWPQSLFGRLLAASVLALLLAEAASLVLVARERERFVLQGNVREWSRRIAEVTTMLQGLQGAERDAAALRLTEGPLHFGHRPGVRLRTEDDDDRAPPPRFARRTTSLPLPFATQGEFERMFAEQLQTTLGRDYRLSVIPTTDPS